MLLERVRESTSDQRFANYVGEGNFTDEQQVVFLANDLIKFIKDADREVRESIGNAARQGGGGLGLINTQARDGGGGGGSQLLDESYLDKILEYAQIVKENPGVGGGPLDQYYY